MNVPPSESIIKLPGIRQAWVNHKASRVKLFRVTIEGLIAGK